MHLNTSKYYLISDIGFKDLRFIAKLVVNTLLIKAFYWSQHFVIAEKDCHFQASGTTFYFDFFIS